MFEDRQYGSQSTIISWSPTLPLKYENSKKFLGAHEVSNCSIIDELVLPVLAEKLNSQSKEKCII